MRFPSSFLTERYGHIHLLIAPVDAEADGVARPFLIQDQVQIERAGSFPAFDGDDDVAADHDALQACERDTVTPAISRLRGGARRSRTLDQQALLHGKFERLRNRDLDLKSALSHCHYVEIHNQKRCTAQSPLFRGADIWRGDSRVRCGVRGIGEMLWKLSALRRGNVKPTLPASDNGRREAVAQNVDRSAAHVNQSVNSQQHKDRPCWQMESRSAGN